MTGFFITGTDTGVGKTYFATQLLQKLNAKGMRTIAIKPVAAGCEQTPAGFCNQDALLLQNAASVAMSYGDVNPFMLRDAIAPHIAADKENKILKLNDIYEKCQQVIAKYPHDCVIIEGAGGWLVPLNEDETMAELAKVLGFPVILIVNIQLGCLNHALLTASQIKQEILPFAGWYANVIDKTTPHWQENIDILTSKLGKPWQL